MSTTTQDPYNATVVGREEIHSELIVLRVRPDGALFEFTPGQFGVLGLLGNAPRLPEANPEEPASEPGKMIRRAYSIASASVERRYVEFYITLITSGGLTPRLFALKHGSRVFLGPKASGMFTIDRVAPDKSVILIATGTGLAPYVSMLRTILMKETQRKFVVLHLHPQHHAPGSGSAFCRSHRPHPGRSGTGRGGTGIWRGVRPGEGRCLSLRQPGNDQDRHDHSGGQGLQARRQQ